MTERNYDVYSNENGRVFYKERGELRGKYVEYWQWVPSGSWVEDEKAFDLDKFSVDFVVPGEFMS